MTFIRSSTCEKLRMWSSVVLSLFRARYGYMKKEPPLELTLSPFHDSLNMKILPSGLAIFTLVKVFEFTHPSSDLSIFMLVKVFELMRPLSDSLTLFRSRWTIVRKRHWESSLLKCFSKLYNLEKPSIFLSLDSLNKHWQTCNGTEPLLPRVR